jgi:hypothetical protein
MAKNSITDYDNIAANNTDIQSVDIDEGCAPSGINNAIRELMADLADVNDGTVPLASPDINGGTIDGVTIGGTTAGAGTFTTGTFSGNLTVDTNTLFVDSANNRVGIGTSSPYGALTVDTANGILNIANGNTSGGTKIQAWGATPSNGYLAIEGYTKEYMRIDSSGNVGIGTTSIAGKFNVGGGRSNFGANSEVYSIAVGYTQGRCNSGQTYYIGATDSATPDLVFSNAAGTERMRIDNSGNVGIGTSSPDAKMNIEQSGIGNFDSIILSRTTGNVGDAQSIVWRQNDLSNLKAASISGEVTGASAGALVFNTATGGTLTERLRLDASGNLLAAKTSTNTLGTVGHDFGVTGYAMHTRASSNVLYLNRTTNDGNIVEFYKDGTTIGSIGSFNGVSYYGGTAGGIMFNGTAINPTNGTAGRTDNINDIGALSFRYDDIYATNGTIQTSDANEKQQIASLTDAEMTAAKAISKLFKTFKWNDKVEAKGDAARRHAGVIAQDVQQAMTDAGLDAGDYAFFISATWWETQTEVPAVEAIEAQDAVYDEDGNIVTEAVEAVEAVDAYTCTDTYDTAEEAPEGATERTRLGIRYPELLSFIGAATEQRLASIESRLDALESV